MKYIFVLMVAGLSARASAQATGNAAPDSDVRATLTLLSETAEGWYAQDDRTLELGFLERDGDLVQSIAWRNCVPIANGTVCEVYGKGSGVDMFGTWRSEKDKTPRVPGAEFRRPARGNDPWDM